MSFSVLIPIIVAIIAPVGAYLIARHKMSGQVDSSEATELWTESRAMRDDYRAMLVRADARITALEARIAKLEELNAELRLRLRDERFQN